MRLDNLINKQVLIHCINLEDEMGILSSFDINDVVLEKKYNHLFFPWQELTYIEEKSPFVEEQKQQSSNKSEKKEIEITCTDDHQAKENFNKVVDMIPEGYEVNWNEEYTEFIVNDDDAEDAILVDLDDGEITVYYGKDFELAKKIAETIEIYSVKKDYQDE